MLSEELLTSLCNQKCSIYKLKTSSHSGIYLIFHKNIQEIIGEDSNEYNIVYVGKTKNFSQREYETHFNSGGSGFSTLRRTIGAVLKEEFKLKAIPRSAGDSETNWRNYKFNFDGEEKITKWMKENLLISVLETNDIDSVETKFIEFVKPIFNLTGWNNPYAKDIKAKRKICAEEAKKQLKK